jgi:hypothetical protein
MKVVKVVVAAFIITSLTTAVVLAGPFGPRNAKGPGESRGECVGFKHHGRPSHPPMLTPEQLAKTGATEEQINALMKLKKEQQLKRIDLKANVEKAELALDYSKKSNSVDEKALLSAVDALNQARGELLKLDVASEFQTRKILGDEIFAKVREQRPHRRHARRRHGRRFRNRERDMSHLEEEPDTPEE